MRNEQRRCPACYTHAGIYSLLKYKYLTSGTKISNWRAGFQETLNLASLVANELAPPSISLPLALYILDPVHGRASHMSGVVHALQTQLSYWHCSRPEPGTYFTCFMSTKVQILTAEEVRARRHAASR